MRARTLCRTTHAEARMAFVQQYLMLPDSPLTFVVIIAVAVGTLFFILSRI
jgi:hypothetical protein